MLLIFSLFSAIVGLTTATIVGLITAESVSAAQPALDLRTTFAVLMFPLLTMLVSEIATVRSGRIGTFVTVACLSIAVLSVLGFPVNGTVIAIHPTRLPWGKR
jgi:hypothetical protein